MNRKSRALVVGGVVAASALGAGTASAVVSGFNGAAQTQHLVRTETEASTFAGSTFGNIPGAAATVRVPSRQSRLITARFTAESQCSGSFGWCSVRFVARNSATGSVVVLHPRSDIDFAFDTVSSDDLWESHSVARVIRLGAGSWTVRAQQATTSDAVTARYDDWTMEVDVNR
jgi:hypothetical protein